MPTNSCWPAGGEVRAALLNSLTLTLLSFLSFLSLQQTQTNAVSRTPPPIIGPMIIPMYPASSLVLLLRLLIVPALHVVVAGLELELDLESILASGRGRSDSTDRTDSTERLLRA